MTARLWLRVFVCGMALPVVGLAGAPTSRTSEPAAPNGEAPPASGPAAAAALLGGLSPEHMKSLGEMLDKDWQNRPEWADMAVAIMKGDFMRPGVGWWKPGARRYDWSWLHERCDLNKDGKVDRDEFPGDSSKASQWFDRLDLSGDGRLTAEDFDGEGPPGASADAMKDRVARQLFSRMDKDSNGRIKKDELDEFFTLADKDNVGFLTPEDLRLAIDSPPARPAEGKANGGRGSAGPSTPSVALRMLLNNELGWLGAGPELDDSAPDFRLPRHDGGGAVRLSDSFGKRPVALIFGSFT